MKGKSTTSPQKIYNMDILDLTEISTWINWTVHVHSCEQPTSIKQFLDFICTLMALLSLKLSPRVSKVQRLWGVLILKQLHFSICCIYLSLCFAGLGGACGYLVGAMDWGHSLIGQLLGSEYQVIYFFSALTWGIFLTVHLFSIPEQPLCKDRTSSDASPASALRLLSSHSNGYGALAKDPGVPAVAASVSDLRPRSFSALSEANSVTSSAKQPNKEVCNVQCTRLLKASYWLY